MADGDSAKELPIEASDRRVEAAVETLKAAYQQKRGRGKAHGEFSVTLHLKAGNVELVTITDQTTYK